MHIHNIHYHLADDTEDAVKAEIEKIIESDQNVASGETKELAGSATVRITGKATLTLIPFPTKWETNLGKFVGEPEFNAIVTELGRLAAADSNQEQEIFDALAYLINKNDFGSAVEFVANQLQNSFDKKKELLRVLYKSKEPDLARQQQLDDILKEAASWHKSRNDFVHSRWAIPDKVSGGVVRLKFDKKLGRDSVEPVKAEALKMIVEGTEASTDKLRKLFGSFGDYHSWIMKRMPPI